MFEDKKFIFNRGRRIGQNQFLSCMNETFIYDNVLYHNISKINNPLDLQGEKNGSLYNNCKLHTRLGIKSLKDRHEISKSNIEYGIHYLNILFNLNNIVVMD